MAAACCPKCKSTNGYFYFMQTTYTMVGMWGEPAEAGDARKTSTSLATCMDCRAKFNFKTAEAEQSDTTKDAS